MDDASVAQIVSFTNATPEQAQRLLHLTDGNTEQAIELFFNSDGLDLGANPATTTTNTTPHIIRPSSSSPTQVSRQYYEENGVVHVDSDEETSIPNQTRFQPSRAREQASPSTPAGQPSDVTNPTLESDEAIARRLQEEFYGSGARGADMRDPDGVRAPIASTRETLVGPGSYDENDEEDMRAAVLEQMRARRERPRGMSQRAYMVKGLFLILPGQPGIFNQRPVAGSVWDQPSPDPNSAEYRTQLARATGGQSETNKKYNALAEMFRPPFDLMSRLTWDEARDEGKEKEKWILVNIQDPSIFDCQTLNRDIWKNPAIRDTIRENFIFMQYSKDDPRANQYVQYYFQAKESSDAYPHIAIVDPRTGEQVKVWSGAPFPKDMEFLMQLHEFLDRYSLSATAKNPVAKRKPEVKKEKRVEAMTEDEMLEAALQNSLAGSGGGGSRDEDPDELTRSMIDTDKGKNREIEEKDDMEGVEASQPNGRSDSKTASVFSTISSSKSHEEPPADPASTRIQFRHPNGRVVRRFALADPVRRLYEWLKASPLEGTEGKEFELVAMGKNLMETMDATIDQAGLKNGTVMVEVIEAD